MTAGSTKTFEMMIAQNSLRILTMHLFYFPVLKYLRNKPHLNYFRIQFYRYVVKKQVLIPQVYAFAGLNRTDDYEKDIRKDI